MTGRRFSKLAWQQQLRGHPLTASQYLVLMTLFSYTDAEGCGAHPGWKRLVVDTNLTLRTVKSAVDVLTKRGYLVKAVYGGNQHRKGLANGYDLGDLDRVTTQVDHVGPAARSVAKKLAAPARELRRPSERELAAKRDQVLAELEARIAQEGVQPVHPFPGTDSTDDPYREGVQLTTGRGAVDAQEGVQPVHPFPGTDSTDDPYREGVQLTTGRGAVDAQEGVQPVHPHQILKSDPEIIPPPPGSGAPCRRAPTVDWKLLQDDFAALEGWLDDELGGDNWDHSAALGMWEGRTHPKTIKNWMLKEGWGKQCAS